ncbi:MAG TPA: class I SAM-dependent methyltransferase [bacterium]|nr:class I SAM-dependent methyltransferase [bacterium]
MADKSLFYNGRLYDSWNRRLTADIPFCLQLAARYGDPLLEIGCGTGRIAVPLAEKGYAVTGLDRAASMLDEAKRKASAKNLPIRWVHSDFHDYRTDEKFALILYPFNTIAHLHEVDDILAVFRKIRSLLTPQGRFFVDMFNPDLAYLTREPGKRVQESEFPLPDGGGAVRLSSSIDYDRARQISHITFYYEMPDGREEIDHLDMRIFYPQELDAYLRFAGFAIEHKFGDYDESPFVSTSPKQLIVARAAE